MNHSPIPALEQLNVLMTLFNSCACAIQVYERDGRVVLTNGAFEKLLAAGTSPTLDPDFPQKLAYAFDGQTVALLLSPEAEAPDCWLAPLKNASGTITHVTCFGHPPSPGAARSQQVHALELVGRLTSGVTHDFSNILGVILLQLDRMIESSAEQSLLELRANATRAERLARQLLSLGQPKPMEFRVLELDEVITDMRPLLAHALGDRIRLELAPASGGAEIRGDQGQLEQIILNLALNARDAMPEGGLLRIETRVVRENNEPFVLLSVADSGCGISETMASYIFDPFFTTKPAGRGTGLGLANVRMLLELCNGSLRLQSTPGQGACFELRFPLVTREKHALPAKVTGTILVIEDEPSLLELVVDVLRHCGYEVLVAADGLQALDLVAIRQPSLDLIITDVTMPAMDGVTLVEAMRRLAAYVATPVLYLSGHWAAEVLSKPQGSTGKTTFLQKPFDAKRLLGKVRESLGLNAD